MGTCIARFELTLDRGAVKSWEENGVGVGISELARVGTAMLELLEDLAEHVLAKEGHPLVEELAKVLHPVVLCLLCRGEVFGFGRTRSEVPALAAVKVRKVSPRSFDPHVALAGCAARVVRVV